MLHYAAHYTPSACSAPYLGERIRRRTLSAAVGWPQLWKYELCRTATAAAGITKDANGFEPRKAGFGLRAFPGVISWVKKCAAQRQARDCLCALDAIGISPLADMPLASLLA